ncbi:MAG: threonine synthase [Alphaproteobacteria bacterium]|nr:threonine synthase [Alphaproteobacteria bacterium]
MRYISTRGTAPALDFADALLAGLADDGGLYVPEIWPTLAPADIAALDGLPFADAVARVMAPLAAPSIGEAALRDMARAAYARFAHPATAPLVQLDRHTWLLELFHGPTLAFKDFALQLLGHLFEHVLSRRRQRATIVGATSGDTGSAAIEAMAGRAGIDIFILHPQGRVSEVQRRQMTTVDAANVHNIAVECTFDDCQDIVKALFADRVLRDEVRLAAINSINWARIAAQAAYYAIAAASLGAPARAVSFFVPTGNFGNVYAGWAARRMGVQIDRFVAASNRNDILFRFFANGDMSLAPVVPSLSPSMDIQVSSNFERLLFELAGRDGAAVAAAMAAFRSDGTLPVTPAQLAEARTLFAGHRSDDEDTLATMARVHAATGMLVDPHTATAISAAAALAPSGSPRIVLATAHPAKFPDAVERATGVRPALPPHLADLFDRPERCATLPGDVGAIAAHIRSRAGRAVAA